MTPSPDKWLEKPFRTPEGLVEVWLYEECWGANVFMLTECSPEAYVQWMKRVMNIADATAPDARFAGTMADVRCATTGALKACVISFPGKWQPSLENFLTLSHECEHATFQILNSKGMPHTKDTDEAFAYLGESLTRRLALAAAKRVIPWKKR